MTVSWTVKGVPVKVLNSDNETSQVILDTSYNSVYDNRLRVRGRRTGTYYTVYTITGHFSETTIVARSITLLTKGRLSNIYITQLQDSPPVSRQSSLAPTLHM